MALLKAVQLCRRAGASVLLRGINLEVEAGEVFVIIGPTGAGKTTLLRLLGLLDEPSDGKIYFDGTEAVGSAVDRVKLRRRMGMVFQKPVAFNSSVSDNIAYPLRVRGMNGKETAMRVEGMLKAVGLQGYGRRKARTLSGGEMQRVALARAMISRPEILFLDEPTANLDPGSAKAIEELVSIFNRRDGLAVVMTTHDLDQGSRLAHRAGVLMGGEFVQTGRPSEIFHSPSDIRVAGFIGIRNILRGSVTGLEEGICRVDAGGRTIEVVCDLPAGSAVDIYIRPEEIVLSPSRGQGSARNSLECRVISLAYSGPLCRVGLDCGFVLEALVTARSAQEMGLAEGTTVYASFKATAARALPASI